MTTEKDQIPDAEIIDTTAVDITDLPPMPAAPPVTEGAEEEVDTVAAIMMVATASVQLSGSLPADTTPEAFNAMLERLVVSYANNPDMLDTFEQISAQAKAYVRRDVMKEIEAKALELNGGSKTFDVGAESVLPRLLSFVKAATNEEVSEVPRLVVRRVRP